MVSYKVARHVIPAEAGIHDPLKMMDPRLCGDDKNGEIQTFYAFINLLNNGLKTSPHFWILASEF